MGRRKKRTPPPEKIYSNKCLVCGTEVSTDVKLDVCEACGSSKVQSWKYGEKQPISTANWIKIIGLIAAGIGLATGILLFL